MKIKTIATELSMAVFIVHYPSFFLILSIVSWTSGVLEDFCLQLAGKLLTVAVD